MTKRFRDLPRPITYQNTRHVFDSSLWQLLWPLTIGGSVMIPSSLDAIDLETKVRDFARYGVEMTDFVPSVFNLLTRYLEQNPQKVDCLRSVRHIFLGGEAANLNAIRRFKRLLPHIILTNTYGPTEASIGNVFHAISGDEEGEVPLGEPIDNTYVLLLDEAGRPVPKGQVGEIHIAGICIGNGYLHEPECTRECFLPNPFPTIPSKHLYKTGDLGIWREDGKLLFRGRLDSQVKLNGARIELSEVESCLLGHEVVAEAVVLLNEEVKALVAFVVCARPIEASELRNFARAKLPGFMVPTRYLVVDELPLTHNGKADRRRLLQMLGGPVALSDARRDTMLGELKKLFTAQLGVGQVSDDANFFDLGGDSLSSLELSLEVKGRLGADIDAGTIYDFPTPQALTRHLCSLEAATEPEVERQWSHEFSVSIPHRYDTPSRPREVLLTGATGFVGLHVLEALSRAGVRVRCLVRADTEKSASRRLRAALQEAQIPVDSVLAQAGVVKGDLCAPRLSLADAQWADLVHGIDAVVHAGGSVDFLKTYDQQRVANVDSIRTLLELAAGGSSKHLHYVSSLSIAGETAGLLDEWVLPQAAPAGGYSQTKWVAEQILAQARQRGLRCSVYRLGEAMPSQRTGFANRRSLVTLLIEACRITGSVPEQVEVDFTPVDFAASVIGYSVMEEYARSNVLNIFNQQTTRLEDYLHGISDAGQRYRTVSLGDFREALNAAIACLSGEAKLAEAQDLSRLRILLPQNQGKRHGGSALEDTITRPGDAWKPLALEPLLLRAGLIYPVVSSAACSQGTGPRVRVAEPPLNQPGAVHV